MKSKAINKCPVCNNDLVIHKLHCDGCNIDITGEFVLNKFSKLSNEQLSFIEIFMKNQGNIKGVEKDLNISYPTVKKLLNEVCEQLGYNTVISNEILSREEIIEKIKRNEINLDEGRKLLEQIKE